MCTSQTLPLQRKNIYKVMTLKRDFFSHQLAGLSLPVLCLRSVALKRFHLLHVTTACKCCVDVRDGMLGEHYMDSVMWEDRTGPRLTLCHVSSLPSTGWRAPCDLCLCPPVNNKITTTPAALITLFLYFKLMHTFTLQCKNTPLKGLANDFF